MWNLFWIEGLLFGRMYKVVRRQGALDRTAGGDEIDQSHLTLETKADYLQSISSTIQPIGVVNIKGVPLLVENNLNIEMNTT